MSSDLGKYLIKPASIGSIGAIANHFISPQIVSVGGKEYRSEMVIGIAMFIAQELITVANTYIYPSFIDSQEGLNIVAELTNLIIIFAVSLAIEVWLNNGSLAGLDITSLLVTSGLASIGGRYISDVWLQPLLTNSDAQFIW